MAMKNQRNLLLVEHGGDTKSFIFDFLREHKDVQVFVVATRTPEWLPAYIMPEHIIIADTYDAELLKRSVLDYLKRTAIIFDGVGTFYEHVVVQTAELAQTLGCININPAAARQSSANKFLMRQVCVDKGIATPRFKLLTSSTKESLKEAIIEFGMPCVIKPIFGAQSYGVKKLESANFIDEDLEEIFQMTDSSKKEVFKNFDYSFLIEEYLSGKVVSVDGIVQEGEVHIAGTIEFLMGPEPHFTQEANIIPARIDTATQEECFDLARKVIAALGFNNCGFHCEMRVTKEGPRLIEAACRLPGGPLQLGYQHAYGFILIEHMIRVWFGEKTTISRSYERHVIQKAVFPRMKGRIISIQGVEEARKIDGVWDVAQIAFPNEEVITYPDIPKPFYYYAAEADSQSELDALGENVERSITIQIV